MSFVQFKSASAFLTTAILMISPGNLSADGKLGPNDVTLAVSVGDPTGTPPTTPGDHVDPNVPTSPFAGVVSLRINAGTMCSGTLISRDTILTAGHCVTSEATGNIDVSPGNVTVNFNHNNPTNNAAGSTQITAAAIFAHPDFGGASNSAHDDLALIRLSADAPAGVPIYPVFTQAFLAMDTIIAGYGNTGDINGFTSRSFYVKRTGGNHVDPASSTVFLNDGLDDEGSGELELFAFDMDGPSDDPDPDIADALGDGTTLGNDIEVTVGSGDSGGPSFVWIDDGDGTVEQGELEVFGINNFLFPRNGNSAPAFGSGAGGVILSSTATSDFIFSVIPEPSSSLLCVIGAWVVCVRRRC